MSPLVIEPATLAFQPQGLDCFAIGRDNGLCFKLLHFLRWHKIKRTGMTYNACIKLIMVWCLPATFC